MSIYENNLLFMEKYAPLLFHTTKKEEPMYSVELKNEENDRNFQIEYEKKICFANSLYNKNSEFEEMFEHINKDCEVLILVGIGDGSVIDYVKKNFTSLKSFFIVEPILEVFRKYVRLNNFKDIFDGMGMITFVVNKNEKDTVEFIMDYLGEDQYSDIEITGLASYFSLLEQWYIEFKQQMLKGIRSKISKFVTLDASKYKWLRNTIYNFRSSHIQQEDIGMLLKGKPGVIVSAGPSLNKHFHLLNDLKERAVIIGAGSAIKILNSKGIKPHFRMVVDANSDDDLYDEVFYDNSEDIPLLYSSQAYEGILHKYKGEKIFMMLRTDILGQYIYSKLDIPYRYIDSGASVVHSAFSFLCQSGCNPIIFIGQDMCFYENELYAEGRASNRQENYHPQSWIKQKDIYGNDVFTIRNYLQIKYDYEALIKQNPDIKFLNATEGGLGIEGVENKPLLDVMNEDIGESFIQDINKEIEKIGQKSKITIERIQPIIEGIVKEVEEIEFVNKNRFELLKKLTKDRENSKKINRLWADLKYIDVQLEKQLTSIPFYNEVLRTLISIQAMALKQKYRKKTDDKLENVERGEKYLYGISTETDIFCQITKDWIQECFNYIEEDKS